MAGSFGYLIPEKSFEIGKFKDSIIASFQTSKAISGYYNEEHQWYAAGELSYLIFEDMGPGYPAFEYVEIHDTMNNRLIPDSTSDNYGVKCNRCYTDIDDSFMEELNKWADREFENGIEMDMALLTVVCGNCNSTIKLGDILFDTDVRIGNQYVCFVEIDAVFDNYVIGEISKSIGCKLDILYGSL